MIAAALPTVNILEALLHTDKAANPDSKSSLICFCHGLSNERAALAQRLSILQYANLFGHTERFETRIVRITHYKSKAKRGTATGRMNFATEILKRRVLFVRCRSLQFWAVCVWIASGSQLAAI